MASDGDIHRPVVDLVRLDRGRLDPGREVRIGVAAAGGVGDGISDHGAGGAGNAQGLKLHHKLDIRRETASDVRQGPLGIVRVILIGGEAVIGSRHGNPAQAVLGADV